MPRPYTSPLQFGRQLQDSAAVNWGHPHSQDLRWFVAPTTGALEDLVSGIAPATLGDYTANYPTPEGPGLHCPTSGAKTTQSAYWSMSGYLKGTYHALTVVVRCILDVLPATFAANILLAIPYNSANASPYGASFQVAASNHAQWNSSDAGTTDMYATGASIYALADGKIHEYAMAYDGTNCTFYRDGAQTDGPTSLYFSIAEPIYMAVTTGVCLLSNVYPATSPASLQGSVLCGGIWTRRLSTSELLSRWERPYQHLQAA